MGIVVHRPVTIGQADRARHRGIPLTAVPLTLIDHAEIAPQAALARVIEQADVLDLLDLHAVDEVLSRHPRRRGSRLLRAAIEAYRPGVVTRSDLETMMLALCEANAIARPRVNARIESLEVDSCGPPSVSSPRPTVIATTAPAPRSSETAPATLG